MVHACMNVESNHEIFQVIYLILFAKLLQEKKNVDISKLDHGNSMTVDEKLEAKVREMLEEENSNGSVNSSDSDSENENQTGIDSMSEISDSTYDQHSQYEEAESSTSKRSADEMSESK